jgi:CubicO group peptidase (beta-lactamase class C family)
MFRSLLAPLLAGLATFAGPVSAADLGSILARSMEGSKVPAMGVLTIRDDKIEGEAVRGVRRNDGTDPVRPDDVWHLGSDGKAMTVTMIARLVDRGVLSWTTPLDQMLPELATTMQPQYRSVTLVQLLSHHTGLPHDIADEKTLHALVWDKSAATLTQRRYNYISRALQDAPVGPTSDANYSNTGLLIAAVVAELATGTSYEELMRKEVFAPLGMSHVGFGVTHSGQPMGHIAGRPARPGVDGNPDFWAPAGNMYMPLEDWARFCIDQLEGASGHGQLLKPETYRLMQTAQPGGDAAMGWGVQASVVGRRGPALVHGGSDGTWNALAVLFPLSGSGVLVAANTGDDAMAPVVSVLKAASADLAPPAG